MCATPYQERQDEEFQVLESIFSEDLEDLRKKSAWKVARPLELRLTLKPQQSMGMKGQVYSQLDMIIKCPVKYPDVVPEISLVNPKGLSNQMLAELKTELDKQASELLGEVMIWQLANSVQEFLHQHNKPPPQSFYEQMINNKKQEQERTKEMERKKEEQKRQEMEQEVLRRQEVLRNETKRRKEDHKQAESSTPLLPPGTTSKFNQFNHAPSPIVPPSPHKGPWSVTPITPIKSGTPSMPAPCSRRQRRTSTPKRSEDEDSENATCKDHAGGVTVLTFSINKVERKIQRGKWLGHSSSGSTVYAGMDTQTGELVAVAEWVMKWRNFGKKSSHLDKEDDVEGNVHLKQIGSIEQEFLTLTRMSHPNLIHYLAWKYQYHPGTITVHVLMEYSSGTNLSVYIRRKDPLPVEMLRTYVEEILEALQYLHQNSIVHKNLRASSIFIDTSGKVRLGDYSIDKRLGDLYETVNKKRPSVHFSDSKPMVLGKGGQRGDIYQLGLMILTLVLGQPLMTSIPDIPSDLPTILQDFLQKCLHKDERFRWTAKQLLEHSFFTDPIQHSPNLMETSHVKGNVPAIEIQRHKEENSDAKEEEDFEYLSSLVASGHSRLASEFELLKVLGKGGFGEVLKVKNKLDGRFYAIKRIPLNPKSKMFNKKMKREVKLLSRLNHENVVRYYCSWIEISNIPASSESSSVTSSSQASELHPPSKKAPHIVRSIPLTKTPVLTAGVKSANSSFDPISDAEHLVPRVGDESVEWLTSFDQGGENLLDSSSDEEEDEADVFGSSFMPVVNRSDDSIVFDTDDTDEQNKDSSQTEPFTEPSTPSDFVSEPKPEELVVKILYIQMEYCEKSTLRSCIDAGLSEDKDRVWRLFREIIEGLVHIHGQGMIHRDLKPVNIFLDSHDHVKIGDFGLATTDILVKEGALLDITMPSPQDLGVNLSRLGFGSGDGNLTGKVGTALYVSPEVMQGGSKVHYDQKVDIYSLGIIFFEMCYKCLPTGMERVKILTNLRQPQISLPEDFDEDAKLKNQKTIILWLLNHDPTQRPTSKELLSSDLLPPPLMQETELSEILRSTICNPQSSSYRYMLNAIFKQNTTTLLDFTYDHDILENMASCKTALVHQQVEASLIKVFTTHGAIHIPTPFFLPKCSVYENNEQLVRLMDHRGGIISVPLDLRVPFARYIGRNNIQSMKRFAIEKVFREKKFYNVLYNIHPKELTECAFDIITSSLSLIPDAEVLTVVQEIINKYPTLQARKYYIRINHMSLLKSVLLHIGIAENLHSKALALLAENITNKTKRTSVLETDLNIKMTEQMASQLNSLLDIEGPFGKVSSILRCITKANGQASSLAKNGLHDIENILSHASCMGLQLEVLVSVGLIYNPNQYSGVVYQVMCDNRKKKKITTEVIAAGGRYDKLIEKFVSPLHSSNTQDHPHGVGISISFERLAAVVADDEQTKCLSPCDIIVCTLGHQMLVKEKLAIAKDLWAAGFRTDVLFDKTEGFEELQENSLNKGISHIVILKDSETSAVKVRSLEKDKMTEKTVSVYELVDYLQRKTMDKGDSGEPTTPNQRLSAKENQGFGDSSHTVTSSNMGNASSNGPTFTYNIQFAFQDSRKNTPARRRHEALIAGKASAQYPWLPSRNLEVLALEMTTSGVKTLQAYLELGDKASFETSISVIMEKQAKLRKYLVGVFDMIHDLRFTKKCNFILVYSIKDETLSLLT